MSEVSNVRHCLPRLSAIVKAGDPTRVEQACSLIDDYFAANADEPDDQAHAALRLGIASMTVPDRADCLQLWLTISGYVEGRERRK